MTLFRGRTAMEYSQFVEHTKSYQMLFHLKYRLLTKVHSSFPHSEFLTVSFVIWLSKLPFPSLIHSICDCPLLLPQYHQGFFLIYLIESSFPLIIHRLSHFQCTYAHQARSKCFHLSQDRCLDLWEINRVTCQSLSSSCTWLHLQGLQTMEISSKRPHM